jgi:tetratricopeptide (TPR) repeat protein
MRFLRTILISLLVILLWILPGLAQPGEQLLAEGRVDEAIITLRGQIDKNPKDAGAFNLLCRAYYTLGDWNRGIDACEKAVSLEPDNSQYHLWLGRIYGEKAGTVNFLSAASLAGKVRTQFEKAVQLNPQSAECRTDLAEFYLEAPGIVGGGRDKAEAQAKELDKLSPSKAHWVRGRLAEKSKDDAAAEKEYRAAIDASHGGANEWLNLALFYQHVGRLREMEEAINQAASAKMNEPEVLVEGAYSLIREGRNFPQAIQMLHRYLSDYKVEEAPAFKAHYLLGTVFEKQGNKQAAAGEYTAALALAKNYTRAQQALERVSR